jgi:type IV secretion system protein VirB10
MFSMLDDVGSYLLDLAKEASNANNTINLNTTGETARNTAGIALEHSINIPPTLRKNQGDNLNIYLARDLDFRGVYAIDFK